MYYTIRFIFLYTNYTRDIDKIKSGPQSERLRTSGAIDLNNNNLLISIRMYRYGYVFIIFVN